MFISVYTIINSIGVKFIIDFALNRAQRSQKIFKISKRSLNLQPRLGER
ncbi:hypothetical protein CAMGR0001_1448 [Campylobacter gracilis RM3268]|uniref:Uncharacterized protein n=1 Tax=Campylobacter gracilis RM3268 TaxID=553220 RepID=C8PJP8_9BACT|nr:hypothetical protein CAMGR0001_1448 [Campylobacter gracilis RM3268]